MPQKFLDPMRADSGAEFSPCRHWRYSLWRRWRAGNSPIAEIDNPLVGIGLNPSDADESINDRTITRLIRFAQAWGHGGLIMLNLYGARSPYPDWIRNQHDPIGPWNDEIIRRFVKSQPFILACWGSDDLVTRRGRAESVLAMIPGPVYCLDTNQDGQPKHPLYTKKTTVPKLYRPGKQ